MATFDDERDDTALDEEQLRASRPQARQPLLLAGLGLALMLGGYAATSYVPTTPRRAEQERFLADFRRQADRSPAEGGNAALSERLNQVTPPASNPPYQMAGRLAIYVGLFLFVMAGVLMYRSSPPPSRDIDDGE